MMNQTSKSFAIGLLLLALLFVFTGDGLAVEAGASLATENVTFRDVNLDQVITHTKRKDSSRLILKPSRPVLLRVKLMRLPEKREISYLFTALNVAGVDPLPEVSHRMFVASSGGKIIPVYVEDSAAALISQTFQVDQNVRFRAYHIYNYSKGPAYLVVGFEKGGE